MVELTSQRVVKGPLKSFAPKVKPRVVGRRPDTSSSIPPTLNVGTVASPPAASGRTVTFAENHLPSVAVQLQMANSVSTESMTEVAEASLSTLTQVASTHSVSQVDDSVSSTLIPTSRTHLENSNISTDTTIVTKIVNDSASLSGQAISLSSIASPGTQDRQPQSQSDAIQPPTPIISTPAQQTYIKIVGARPTGRPSIKPSRQASRGVASSSQTPPGLLSGTQTENVASIENNNDSQLAEPPQSPTSPVVIKTIPNARGTIPVLQRASINKNLVSQKSTLIAQPTQRDSASRRDISASSASSLTNTDNVAPQEKIHSLSPVSHKAQSLAVNVPKRPISVHSPISQDIAHTSLYKRPTSPQKSSVATTYSKVPVLASEIHLLSMKDISTNGVLVGRISKAEEARQLMVRESRKRKRSNDPNATTNVSTAPSLPTSAPHTQDAPADTRNSHSLSGPRLRIVDGQLRIDESSLLFSQASQDPMEELQRVEEGPQRYVTSQSFRNRKNLRKVAWSKAMTGRFFDGLSYFGTDFSLIALMFPGLSRNHIKLKFAAEEGINPKQVTFAIRNKRVPGNDIRSRMMGMISEKKALHADMYYGQAKVEGSSSANLKHQQASTKPIDTEKDTNNDATGTEAATEETQPPKTTNVVPDSPRQRVDAAHAPSTLYALPASLSHIERLRTNSRTALGSVRPRIGPNPRPRRPVRPTPSDPLALSSKNEDTKPVSIALPTSDEVTDTGDDTIKGSTSNAEDTADMSISPAPHHPKRPEKGGIIITAATQRFVRT
ncbi:hypothetical protein BASA62_005818 [Batrachochytrium salamandrivorans]|nr:hypothetical protein BASA62_005818 [Batrachochytrium salamandrivorans]